MFAQLKPQVDALVEMAKQNSNANDAADILFDSMIVDLPDMFYEKLGDFFDRAEFVSQIAVFNPAVNQYRDWFEKFRAQVQKRFIQEDATAGQEPTDAAS